ncbi:GNAT family N-acetyltransferase [Pseudomonas sp. D2-5]
MGQLLVAAYVESARQAGFVTLSLHVRSDNPARQLYARAGFAEVGTNALGYLRYELQAAA